MKYVTCHYFKNYNKTAYMADHNVYTFYYLLKCLKSFNMFEFITMTKQFVPSYTHHSRCLCGLLVWSVGGNRKPRRKYTFWG